MPDAEDARRPQDALASWLDSVPPIAVGLALVGLAALTYWFTGYDRPYNHFVLQAQAFLAGRAEIPTPRFQDVLPVLGPDGEPTGFALLPFPPLPAIVLVPFVAIWGLATDERVVGAILGAIAVGLAWLVLGQLAISRAIRLATTVFFAFGTVFWYAAEIGSTWYFAHVVAVTCLFLAVGAALVGDPGADEPGLRVPRLGAIGGTFGAALRRPLSIVDGRQVLAGFLFGLACTARLTIVFGAPFFVLVGGGRSWLSRAVSAGIGAAVPVAALIAYNLATTGHPFSPVYDYLYHIEAIGYPTLNYHSDWGIEDIRYLPQNLGIMLGSTPVLFPGTMPSVALAGQPLCLAPGATRGLFDPNCPIALPRDVGMSLILTSPAYLLLIPAVIRRHSRLVVGAVLAVVAIAVANLLHFSQGWVQFGYRFSNDFVVFALPLVALGMARRRRVGWLGIGLIAASIVINAWGVAWGNVLGW